VDGLGDQVDERARAGLPAGEGHRRRGAEGALAGPTAAVGDVEDEVVPVDGQDLGAAGGIGAGQVRNGHTPQLPTAAGEQPRPDPPWQLA
jgi:hypothetical protein